MLHDGGFGEYVTLSENAAVTKIPAGIDIASAGVLGLAGVAAMMSVEAVAPEAGQTVVIAGATGGVGAYAIQMVAARGAEVIATAKPGEEAEFVRALGATSTVDYSADVADAVRALHPGGVDAVIHLAGDASRLADILKPDGRLSSTLLYNPEMYAGWPVTVIGIAAYPDAARLDFLSGEVAAQRLKISIQRSYPLEQIQQAFADFAAGTCGKLAIVIG